MSLSYNRQHLYQEWEKMIEAIGWISPTTRDSVLAIDHFDDTYHNGKARIDAALRLRFHLP